MLIDHHHHKKHPPIMYGLLKVFVFHLGVWISVHMHAMCTGDSQGCQISGTEVTGSDEQPDMLGTKLRSSKRAASSLNS